MRAGLKFIHCTCALLVIYAHELLKQLSRRVLEGRLDHQLQQSARHARNTTAAQWATCSNSLQVQSSTKFPRVTDTAEHPAGVQYQLPTTLEHEENTKTLETAPLDWSYSFELAFLAFRPHPFSPILHPPH
jgi:hypothetical protein